MRIAGLLTRQFRETCLQEAVVSGVKMRHHHGVLGIRWASLHAFMRRRAHLHCVFPRVCSIWGERSPFISASTR
ncbi:MAG: hypothetical protein ACYDG3_10175, partial [Bacillati bacterium]